jgi:hypothetical protein
MVQVSAAVEHDSADTRFGGALGNEAAYGFRALDLRFVLCLLAHGLVERGGRRESMARLVVNHLCINVYGAPEDIEPWGLLCTLKTPADVLMPANSS